MTLLLVWGRAALLSRLLELALGGRVGLIAVFAIRFLVPTQVRVTASVTVSAIASVVEGSAPIALGFVFVALLGLLLWRSAAISVWLLVKALSFGFDTREDFAVPEPVVILQGFEGVLEVHG